MSGAKPHLPNYYGRQLQRLIRRLREQAQLTQEEAGERLHIDHRKLSRLERRQLPTYHELVLMLDVYGVLAGDYAPYLELHDLAKQRDWWRSYALKQRDKEYIRMEDAAAAKYEFQLGQVPTLLQTESYARATLSSCSRKSAAALTEVRMQLQQRLTAEPKLTLRALIHEPVLHQGVDGDQLRKLLDFSQLPNVTIQVVPQAKVHDGLKSSMILLSFDDPDEPEATFFENVVDLHGTQDPDRTATVKRVLANVTKLARSPEQSVALIQDLRGS